MPSAETKRQRRRRAPLLGAAAAALCACATIACGAFAPVAQAAPSPSSGTFVERTPSPAPIAGVAADPTNGMVYAQEAGGKKFFAFDPRSDAWSEMAQAPIGNESPYAGAGATYLEGKIYLAYGYTPKIGVYDIATNAWSTIESPLKESAGELTAYGKDLYVVNGEKFASYDPSTGAEASLAPAPPFPSYCTGFTPYGGLQAYEGKIYGDQGEGGCNGFAVYEIEEGKEGNWTELHEEVPGFGAAPGSALDPATGTYFLYGVEGNLDSYDIATKAWTTTSYPFGESPAGGMAYVSLPNVGGVYAAQGAEGTGFTLYTHEPLADLSATASMGLGAGNEAVYTLKVENNGPATATKAILSDALSGNLSFISAQASQGSCEGTSTITCSLGSLAANGTASVTIKASAKISVVATNTVAVTSEALDPNLANNTDTILDGFVLTPASATITTAETKPATPAATYCVVPSLHGLTLGRLKEALTAAHCALGSVSSERDPKVGRRRVIESNPYTGAVLVAGSRVDVLVSLGGSGPGRRHARCVVPGRLHGLMLKRAKRMLRAAHCRPGRIVRRRDAKVGSGRVIATKPGHGRSVPAGSRVTVWVSEGRRHRG